MILTTRFVVAAALGTLVAMPVAAKSDKDKLCEEFGAASTQIAEMRRAGDSEMDAQLAFVKDNGDSPLLALQLVPFVSNYVYTLTEEQLAGDVETPLVEQCKEYNG